MTLRIALLGPPRITREGEPISFETRKATALLAHLALTEHPRSREALCELLYLGHDPDRARGALRHTFSTLRKGVGEQWIDTTGDTVGLRCGPGLEPDVKRFRELAGHDAPRARLDEAVGLFAGRFLGARPPRRP